jgi:hypothetical protein
LDTQASKDENCAICRKHLLERTAAERNHECDSILMGMEYLRTSNLDYILGAPDKKKNHPHPVLQDVIDHFEKECNKRLPSRSRCNLSQYRDDDYISYDHIKTKIVSNVRKNDTRSTTVKHASIVQGNHPDPYNNPMDTDIARELDEIEISSGDETTTEQYHNTKQTQSKHKTKKNVNEDEIEDDDEEPLILDLE